MSVLNINFVNERVLAGGFANASIVKLNGRNAAISSSAETVWGPGATYARLASAVALEVVSASADDAAAGTGARTVEVDLLDGDYTASTVTVTLNGTTPVAITGTFLAVNGVRVATAGSGLANAGVVSVRTVSGSVVKRQLTAGATMGIGQDADFIYTVPAGYKAILRTVSFSGTGVTGDLTAYVNTHDSGGLLRNIGAGKSSLYVTAFNGARGEINFGSGVLIQEKTLIELRAIVSAGAGDLVASSELLLFKASGDNSLGL